MQSRGASVYQFCATERSWSNALGACAAADYHLATIDDALENNWLAARAVGAPQPYWWTGLHDPRSNNTWVWEDGTPVAYTNWHSSQPNGSSDDCAYLYNADAAWWDWTCGVPTPYLCEAACTTVWYGDSDGDGFGAGAGVVACDQPPGTVLNDADCDDGDASVAGALTWWSDIDGDGFGDPAGGFTACGAPAGGVLVAGDCDDSDARAYPGASEELGDGVDQDCNEEELCYADADDDGYADQSTLVTSLDLACDGPGERGRPAPSETATTEMQASSPAPPRGLATASIRTAMDKRSATSTGTRMDTEPTARSRA